MCPITLSVVVLCVVSTTIAVWHAFELYSRRRATKRINKITEKMYKSYNQVFGPTKAEELMSMVIRQAINNSEKGSTRIALK